MGEVFWLWRAVDEEGDAAADWLFCQRNLTISVEILHAFQHLMLAPHLI
jgi:transposase-like protein